MRVMGRLNRYRDALPCSIPADNEMAGPPALAISFHAMTMLKYLKNVQLRQTVCPELVNIVRIEHKAEDLRC